MSKEFEEIVLKKLDALEGTTLNTAKRLEVLDERTQNTDKVIENVVLKKLEDLEQSTVKRLDALEYTTQKMQKENAKKFGEMEIELKDTREIVKNLSENFAKFDYEINKKIDTLFDGYTVNKEKNEIHEGDIVSLNAKVFNHDIRISNLEEKILAV